MGFGIVLSSTWPLYFGTLLSSYGGRLGMVAAYLLVAVITIWLVSSHARRFTALANGLLALGILSLFVPFIPAFIGILWIGAVSEVMPGRDHHLEAGAATIVTMLYAVSYIIVAFGCGTAFQAMRGTSAPRRSSASRRRPPSPPPSAP